MKNQASKILFLEKILAGILIIAASFALIPIPEKLIFLGDQESMLDFVIYYTSALIFNNGHVGDIYNPIIQQQIQSDLAGKFLEVTLPYYLYPPYSILLYSPFTRFTPAEAYFIWRIINCFLTFVLLDLLCKELDAKKPGAFIFGSTLTVISPPWMETMYLGQPVLLIPLGLIAFKLLLRRRPTLSCFILILTTLKPPLTIGPILYLLITNYSQKLVIAGLCVGITILALCYGIFGLYIWQSYLEALLGAPNMLSKLAGVEFNMGNIKSVALHLYGREYSTAIHTFSMMIWLGSIVFTVYAALRTRISSEPIRDIVFSLIMVISCIFGPWSYVTNLILLIIPVGYMLKYSGRYVIYLTIMGVMISNWIFFHDSDLKSAFFVIAQFLMMGWLCYMINIYRKKPTL